MGYNPQESLENTINTMGTLLGVPIVPWNSACASSDSDSVVDWASPVPWLMDSLPEPNSEFTPEKW